MPITRYFSLASQLTTVSLDFIHVLQRGHALPPVWVLGMVNTTPIPADGYMEVVPNRDAVTLIEIIQANFKPGTVIWSDR